MGSISIIFFQLIWLLIVMYIVICSAVIIGIVCIDGIVYCLC